MPSKVGQNSFEKGLNTDVNLYNTPANVLVKAENVTQSTLAEDQFILQNEEGNAEVIYNNAPVTLSPGYIPLAVKVYNNIAYIISVDTVETNQGGFEPGESVSVLGISEDTGDGYSTLKVLKDINTDGIQIGDSLTLTNFDQNGVYTVTSVGTLGLYWDLGLSSVWNADNGGDTGTVTWVPVSVENTSIGFATEIGTFPSPNWDLLLDELPSSLNETYSPLHNFKATSSSDFIDPFKAQLGYIDSSEIDIEIQQSFDGSVNIIFTDGKNPVKLVNSRFKPSEDNPNAYILANRTDLASRDTNVYSADDISQTNLIFTLSSVPELTFDGVIESAGQLPEGNYKYYFKAVDADGNETPIIEESRTVSIFSGIGKTAHTTLDGISSKATSFSISFSSKDVENISGINLYYSYFKGEFDSLSEAHKLLTTFRNKTSNSFSIIHTGLETTEPIALQELNVIYNPINTAKTISQIRSRLALANVSYDSVDILSLAEASYRIRIGEEDVTINRDYSDVYSSHSGMSDILYSNPNDIYGSTSDSQKPGIGYWREETYVCAVHWILDNDFVTDAFPIKGIDRVKSSTAIYTAEDSDTHDYIANPFNTSNGHENRLGVYRTDSAPVTDANGHLVVKKLKFTGISEAISYLVDAGIPIKGYFFSRKNRVKDCLWEGVAGGLHRMPTLQNFQGSTVWAPEFNSDNDDRLFFLPAMGSAKENWEDMFLCTVGSNMITDNKDNEARADMGLMTAAGLKLVPSNAGWLETVNPYINGYEASSRDPVNGGSIRDIISFQETGSYDYINTDWDSRIANNEAPSSTEVNRVAFHSADMSMDPAGMSRDFEGGVSFEIADYDNVDIKFNPSEIGTGGNSKVVKFYLDAKASGSFTSLTSKVRINSRFIEAGTDVAVEEQFSAVSDRNIYKHNKFKTAYEPVMTAVDPVDSRFPGCAFVAGSGKQQWTSGGTNTAPTINNVRAHDMLRSFSVISTEYGSYFGCKLLNFNDDNILEDIPNFNNYSSTFYSTRFSNNLPTSTTQSTFGRYTRVYKDDGSIKDNETAWRSLYTNLSGTYKSISKRYTIVNLSDVSVGEGDCFSTIAWKQLTRKRGLPNNITENFPKVDTYYRGVDTKTNDGAEQASRARLNTDIKSSGPLGYTQGLYIPLIHQNNNNVAVRSIETVEPTEKNLIGSDREFHPLRSTEILRTRPQIESNKYNFGLNFSSDKFYTPANINVPATNSEFSTRVVLSNASATSEFSNGYRTFENINFKDYNRDYGSITKLESFNNSLYCIQESAISTIGVDDRTLTTDAASGKIFINAGDLLPSTLTNINSEYGSGEFYSVIQTDAGIFGIDYIKNRPWRINGNAVELLSEFKVQTQFNVYKEATKGGITVIPVIKTHFDRLTNKVYFNYNVVSSEKFAGTGLGYDQNLTYNTNTDLWVGETQFTPGISFTVNDGFYTVPQNSSGIWKHNQVDRTIFYGIQKEMTIEFVLLGDNATGQKILENLKIVSNNVVPKNYEYTVEDLVTYNKTGTHSTNNPTFSEDAVVRGDVIESAKGEFFRANIMQANTQYRENSMDVQVGKRTNTSARIRDKAIRIKIVYDGTEKVTIQQVLSIYRDSYA